MKSKNIDKEYNSRHITESESDCQGSESSFSDEISEDQREDKRNIKNFYFYMRKSEKAKTLTNNQCIAE